MPTSTEFEPVCPVSALPHDRMTRILHWTTALLVLTQYGLSLAWERLPRGAAKHLAIVTHTSFGITLTVVLVTRIAWRLSSASTSQVHEAGLQGLAARAVHLLLYVLLILQALSGWNYRWAEGEPLSFFGLLISPPFLYRYEAAGVIGLIHHWTGTAIIALSSAHLVAALVHHCVLHDQVLYRMLPWRSTRRPF